MFYCNVCAEKNKWPQSISKSQGKCECCGAVALCNDVKSADLPTPPPDLINPETGKRESKTETSATFYCVMCSEKHKLPPSVGQGGKCTDCGCEQKVAFGEFKYEFTISPSDISIRHQENNENNLAAFHATKHALVKTFDLQMEPGSASQKMSKSELKELQIAITVLTKYISELGNYTVNKYKDAVPEEKKKIKTINPLHHIKNIKG